MTDQNGVVYLKIGCNLGRAETDHLPILMRPLGDCHTLRPPSQPQQTATPVPDDWNI